MPSLWASWNNLSIQAQSDARVETISQTDLIREKRPRLFRLNESNMEFPVENALDPPSADQPNFMPKSTLRNLKRSLGIRCLGLGLSVATYSATGKPIYSVEGGFESIIKPIFEERCIKCHGLDGKEKGDLNLLEIGSAAELINDPERLEEIIDVLDFEDMPPEEEEPMDPDLRNSLLDGLRAMLDTAIANQTDFDPDPDRRRRSHRAS